MRRLSLAIAIALLPLGAHAAEADTQALIDELRQLSDKAREQRAADRWLQRALDDLVMRYDWPWRKELVFDDFADGDYQSNPSWQVVNGRFWVARGRGLRSRAETDPSATPSDSSQQQQPSVEAAVIGALLQHALGGGNGGNGNGQSSDAPATAVSSEPSEIRLSTPITNAFAVEAEFSLETPDAPGRMAFALLQGSSGRYGYRLRLQTGRDGFAELERVRGGAAGVVEHAKLPFDAGDGAQHRLGWRQAANGDVTVEIDGQTLFAIRDKAFRDDYQQLVLSHWSGDLTLHNIRVSGTE